jgi:predicted component of type VI protein secretion system
MTAENNKTQQRERDEASIELLRKLREKLLSNNISTARVAALNLSWKQEDGLVILKEALLGNYPRTAKKAAAYGLRSMNGRMQKMASEVLEQGLRHRDRTTKAACIKSISLMKG